MPGSILKDKQTNAWFFLKRQSEAKELFRQLIQKGCFLKNEKLSDYGTIVIFLKYRTMVHQNYRR